MTLLLASGRHATNAVASTRLIACAKRTTVMLALLATGLAATGCATYSYVEEMPVSRPLAPMQEPHWEAGTTWHYLMKLRLLDSGWRVWQKLESQRDDTLRMVSNRGFRVTNLDMFSPATRATDYQLLGRDRRQDVPPTFDSWPREGSVVQEVTRTGDIWPLEVGRSWRYTVARIKYRRIVFEDVDSSCLVQSQVRVEVPAGSFDTFKVVCESRFWKGTWYVAPSLGTYALYVSDPDRWEVVRFEYVETKMPESDEP